jgi:hypothetical protein
MSQSGRTKIDKIMSGCYPHILDAKLFVEWLHVASNYPGYIAGWSKDTTCEYRIIVKREDSKTFLA